MHDTNEVAVRYHDAIGQTTDRHGVVTRVTIRVPVQKTRLGDLAEPSSLEELVPSGLCALTAALTGVGYVVTEEQVVEIIGDNRDMVALADHREALRDSRADELKWQARLLAEAGHAGAARMLESRVAELDAEGEV